MAVIQQVLASIGAATLTGNMLVANSDISPVIDGIYELVGSLANGRNQYLYESGEDFGTILLYWTGSYWAIQSGLGTFHLGVDDVLTPDLVTSGWYYSPNFDTPGTLTVTAV